MYFDLTSVFSPVYNEVFYVENVYDDEKEISGRHGSFI